jgi:hypothetical protein
MAFFEEEENFLIEIEQEKRACDEKIFPFFPKK